MLAWAILIVATPVFLGAWLLAAVAQDSMRVSAASPGFNEQGVAFARFLFYPLQFARYLALASLVAAIGMLMRWGWARPLLLLVSAVLILFGIGTVAFIGVSFVMSDGGSLDLPSAVFMMVPFALLAGITWPLFTRLRSTQATATSQCDAARVK